MKRDIGQVNGCRVILSCANDNADIAVERINVASKIIAAGLESITGGVKMLTVEQLKKEVEEVIVGQLGCDSSEVRPGAQLGNDLGADSLDEVEIVFALEEHFGIEIPDEDSEKFKTVGDITRYVEGKVMR